MQICITQRDGIRHFSRFTKIPERDRIEVELTIEDEKLKVYSFDLTEALFERFDEHPEILGRKKRRPFGEREDELKESQPAKFLPKPPAPEKPKPKAQSKGKSADKLVKSEASKPVEKKLKSEGKTAAAASSKPSTSKPVAKTSLKLSRKLAAKPTAVKEVKKPTASVKKIKSTIPDAKPDRKAKTKSSSKATAGTRTAAVRNTVKSRTKKAIVRS